MCHHYPTCINVLWRVAFHRMVKVKLIQCSYVLINEDNSVHILDYLCLHIAVMRDKHQWFGRYLCFQTSLVKWSNLFLNSSKDMLFSKIQPKSQMMLHYSFCIFVSFVNCLIVVLIIRFVGVYTHLLHKLCNVPMYTGVYSIFFSISRSGFNATQNVVWEQEIASVLVSILRYYHDPFLPFSIIQHPIYSFINLTF